MAMIHFRKETRIEFTVKFRVVIPKTQDSPVLSGSVSLKLTRSLNYNHVAVGGRSWDRILPEEGRVKQAGKKKEKGRKEEVLGIFLKDLELFINVDLFTI